MQIIEIQLDGLDDALRQMGRKFLKPAYRDAWDEKNPRDGFCYVIAEVIYHYCNPGGFEPFVINWGNGTTHWYLMNARGDVIDPGYPGMGSEVDPGDAEIFRSGRKVHFLTRELSKRGHELAKNLKLE